jgi:hypothetical protein
LLNTGKENGTIMDDRLYPKDDDKTAPAPPAEISADAAYIVKSAREDVREAAGRVIKQMWIIFVLLPVVLGALLMLVK